MTLASFFLGLAAGVLRALFVPPLVWGVFFAGLAAGWWGSGLGEGWPYAALVLATAATVACAVGVLLRRVLHRSRRSREVGLHR